LPAPDQTDAAYLHTVEEALARLATVEQDLRALLDLEPLRARVQRLRCFRGIDDLTALTIAAELGDPRWSSDRPEHDGLRGARPLRAFPRVSFLPIVRHMLPGIGGQAFPPPDGGHSLQVALATTLPVVRSSTTPSTVERFRQQIVDLRKQG
jgi:hypothetical protein